MNPLALQALIRANPTADAAAILALAQADPRTVRPIPLTGVGGFGPYMTSGGRLTRLKRTAEYLTQQAMAIADADQKIAAVSQADTLADFCGYAISPNGSFDLTDLGYAQQTDTLFTAMIHINSADGTTGLTAQEQKDIIAMGGGYAVKDATADHVAAAMAAVARADAVAALRTLANQAASEAFALQVTRTGKIDAIARGTDAVPSDLAALDAYPVGA